MGSAGRSPGRTSMGAELSGPAGLGETLRDDTSGSCAPHDGAADGGVSLSILSGRRSPKDKLCCDGLRSELQGENFGYP